MDQSLKAQSHPHKKYLGRKKLEDNPERSGGGAARMART